MSAHCLFCGGRLFAGLDACGHCGAIRDTIDEKRVGARCPRCHDVRLIQFALDSVALQACGGCQGSFLPAAEWDNLLDSFDGKPFPDDLDIPETTTLVQERAGGNPYRESLPPSGRQHAKPDLAEPVSCPTCEVEMDRLEFNGVSNIMVDVCRLHGIWLDGGELALVVENARRSPLLQSRADQDAREDAMRKAIWNSRESSAASEPSLAALLARRLLAVARSVVGRKDESR